MKLEDVFLALIIIGVLVLAAKYVRDRIGILRRLYMPSSVLAGIFALLAGPQVLGAAAGAIRGEGGFLSGGLIPTGVLDVWAAMPGLLISVVFAALFLGKRIPGIRDIWSKAGPQVAFGQSLAWGQYVLGLVLALLLLGPVFGMDPMAGALIEIGFEGGHGTAAGLAGTFDELGFAAGADMAMGLATVGIVGGVAIGTALINWAVRTGRTGSGHPVRHAGENARELSDFDEREPAPEKGEDRATEPMSLHLGFIGLAVAVGWLLLQGLILLEDVTLNRLGAPDLMALIPLFPMAMIGGILVQVALDKLGRADAIDRTLINHVSGAALDFLIVAALGTLSLAAIGDNIVPFLILAAAGLAWNLLAFLFLAPRMIPSFWFERGIGDFGQSTGMTATGLLLMRVSDPENDSGAMESFGYKQLLFEPVVGGGLFTAASLPLISGLGPVVVLLITSALTAAFITLGLVGFGGPGKRIQRQKGHAGGG